jgi:hypothetical protein
VANCDQVSSQHDTLEPAELAQSSKKVSKVRRKKKKTLLKPNMPKMRIVVKSTKTISFDENFEDDESSEHENDLDDHELDERIEEESQVTERSAVREPVKSPLEYK